MRPAYARADHAPLAAGIIARRAGSVSSPRTIVSSLVNADQSSASLKLYHYVNLALLGATPVAFAVSPSPLTLPLDLFLGVAFPVHAHIGMNCVISDYAKKFFGSAAVGPARVGMLGVTTITTLGLLRLNLQGPGLIETIKGLWRKPKPAQ